MAAAKRHEISSKRLRLVDQKRLADNCAGLINFVLEVWQKTNSKRLSGDSAHNKLTRATTARQLSEVASSVRITPSFFDKLRKERRFREILYDLDVADEDQLELFETLDANNSGSLDLQELVLGIVKLRGEARRADIVGVDLLIRNVQATIRDFEHRVIAKLGTRLPMEIAQH
eukprot:CAMPEP_0115381740 /NCGR_PEP_ID=MMETSP0271-20121206/5730_1 /TAXON_ID=71861 /ORGANISM="Scrippsiella trochoidea, Strain CCMP3099" /LENGTH=172 /DNA_ID=CAMNT_0002805037 /DNA_START=92 /DNA_END=610 /DNA_ORIENTATION=-